MSAFAERDLLAHVGDFTVTVEVIETVFVHKTIAVVIDGDRKSTGEIGGGGLRKPALAAVDVHHRDGVERGAIEKLGNAGQFAVVLQNKANGVERDFRPLNLVGVGGAIDVDGGFGGGGAGLGIGDGDQPGIATGAGFAQRFELHPIRIGGRVATEDGEHLGVGIETVPVRIGRVTDGFEGGLLGEQQARNEKSGQEARHGS